MPLNSNHLNDSVIKILREIPEDNECLVDEKHSSLELMPYQTKVQIYDERCKGCGFVHIEATHYSALEGEKKIIFTDLDKAIDHATVNNCRIHRSCSYPNDVLRKNGKHIYPTLSEIVSNTCEFWFQDKIDGMIPEEVEFIEIDDVEKIIVRISEECSI